MKMLKVRSQLAVLLSVIFCIVVSGSKLNVPRVLLPLFSDLTTNFTLQVKDGGCYKWSQSREDVIQLTPLNVKLDSGCSSQVVVSATTKVMKRRTVIVFAEEISSKQIIPCDVVVDVIHSLRIVTQTHELYVEEAPQTFEVRAYDDQDNEFTTLEGVEMEWTVSQSGTSGIVSFMSFKDSPYDTPSSVAHFDQIGVRGHIILLEGIKTGSTKVSVKLPHKEYSHILPIEIQLMVVAKIIIDPANVYLLPGDSITYRIFQVRHGRLYEIELPSQQYYLEVEDTQIAEIKGQSSRVQALEEGQTKVSLRDRNMDPNDLGSRTPQAFMNVALPAFIHLTLLPYKNWAVLVEDRHAVSVEVFDRSNHKFHVDGVKVKVIIPEAHFLVESSTLNGTYHAGWPLKPGTARVEAVLMGVTSSEGVDYPLAETLSTQEDMFIYPRMDIQPKETVLPWDPRNRAKYETRLRCEGGDGSLLWSSGNTSVATVSQSGTVRTLTLGQSSITAAMIINPYNRASASVMVLPPVHLQIINAGLEAEVGAHINIQVAMYAKRLDGSDRLPFTNCQELPLKVTVWDENFTHKESHLGKPIGEACTVITILGTSVGTSKVTVSYEEGDILLTDTAVVAAFKPLTVQHPSSGETVLAVGTSRQLVFVGGPRPWPGISSEHGKVLSLGDGAKNKKDMLETTEVPRLSKEVRDRYVYTVLCRQLGETIISLTVFKEGKSGHRIESHATVHVFCAKPRFASLKAVLHSEENTSCPMNVNAERIAVQSSKELEVELNVSDVHGRVFDNITSILMEWTATPSHLGTFKNKDGTFSDDLHEEGLVLPHRHFQVIRPVGDTGAVDISVRLTGYRSVVLRAKQITPEWPAFSIKSDKGLVTPEIKASLSLLFVSDTLVMPNFTTLFNHPNSKLTLRVSQGSGYFEPKLENQDVAIVRYLESSGTLEVRPRSTGVARFGLVDLCLPSRPAVVTVTVVGVLSIIVDVADRLQRGKYSLCSVHITDTMGNPLQLNELSMLGLRPQLEGSSSTIIAVKVYESDPDMDRELGISGSPSVGEFRFLVHGLALGDASLTFTTGQGPYEVRSASVSIQVFDPLRLNPRNLTLLVGSQFLIGVSNGPSRGMQLEFQVSHAGLVRVSPLGLVEGEKIGHTQLTCQVVGVSKFKGNKIIFSEDTIDVHVVPLMGVRIESPLTRLKVDSMMPVWVSGVPDPLSPLILGSTTPSLAFKWELSSREVAEIIDVLGDMGVEVTDEHRVSIRIRALSPGRTTLRLSVFAFSSMTGTPEGELYEKTLLLEVYEELHLTHPLSVVGRDYSYVLIAPNTQMQLRSNRDGLSHVHYSLQSYPSISSGDINTRDPSALVSEQSPILSLSPSGLITTHSTNGRSAITVSAVDETSMRQSRGLTIEVKPVHYIMTNVRSALLVAPDTSARALPKGLELQLEITYHDTTGAVFAATRTGLDIQYSRADLVQISRLPLSDQLGSNSSFQLTLLHTGNSVLYISDHIIPSQAADFIKLPIEEYIFPSETKVTIGDVICFSMPLVSRFGDVGHWLSDNSDLVLVDGDLGIGRARSAGGPVLVKYMLSNYTVSSTEIEVVPISSLVFINAPKGYLKSKTSDSGGYRVGLLLTSEHDENKQSNFLSKGDVSSCLKSSPVLYSSFPFNCEARFNSQGMTIQIYDVFDIKPVFDEVSGQYACELLPIGESSADVSQLQTNVTLRARAAAWAGGAVSAPLVLPFLPAFHIDSQEIILPGGAPGQLEVKAVPQVLAQLQVLVVEDGMVHVSSPQHITESSVLYFISLTSKFWGHAAVNELQFIQVLSPLTNQNVKLSLKLRLDPDQLSAPCVVAPVGSLVDLAYSNRHLLIMVASIIVISLGTLYVYATFIQPAFRAPAQPFLQSGTMHSHSPHLQSLYTTRSNVSPNISLNRSAAFSESEPVYGDPRLYLYGSPRQRM